MDKLRANQPDTSLIDNICFVLPYMIVNPDAELTVFRVSLRLWEIVIVILPLYSEILQYRPNDYQMQEIPMQLINN